MTEYIYSSEVLLEMSCSSVVCGEKCRSEEGRKGRNIETLVCRKLGVTH